MDAVVIDRTLLIRRSANRYKPTASGPKNRPNNTELAWDSANSASCATKFILEKFISCFRYFRENLKRDRHLFIFQNKAHPTRSLIICCHTNAQTPNPVKARITPTIPLINVDALLANA